MVGLEDTAVRYESVGRMNRVEVCQVGQLRDLPNPTKQGTLPTFFMIATLNKGGLSFAFMGLMGLMGRMGLMGLM